MLIVPNSSIHILRGVPFTPEYKHTTKFATYTDQQNYFRNKKKLSFDNCTYIREQRKIRVGCKADDIFDCNYLMFRNTSYNDKWFYAFILSVEYINDNACEITFEIDVFQTWQFQVTFKECFVEREHVSDDTIGSNLVPESLETGDYVSGQMDGTNLINGKSIVVASTFNQNYEDMAGGMYAGIYSGLYFNTFSNYTDVNTFIDGAVTANKGDGIVAVFMMPTAFITTVGGSVKIYDVIKTKKLDNIDGYVPKNNKLFTYPYNFLYCTNFMGNSANFMYEYFSTPDVQFILTGDMSCDPSVVLVPKNYKGVLTNYNEKLVLNGFPQCSYNTDAFKAWLAQNGGNLAISTLSSAVMLGGGIATGNPALIAKGAMDSFSNLYNIQVKGAMPPQAHGATGSQTMSAIGLKDFGFFQMQIRSEMAQIIDNYFTMFGYAVHKVKIPDINGRPTFNYVKTNNCCHVGNIPPDDLEKIRNIFNSGVTFWKNPENVGNYSLDNKVVI